MNRQMNDREVELLWEEFSNFPFDEGNDGGVYLSTDWRGFPAGTSRDDIWHWFDAHHSKGVFFLLYEYWGGC